MLTVGEGIHDERSGFNVQTSEPTRQSATLELQHEVLTVPRFSRGLGLCLLKGLWDKLKEEMLQYPPHTIF